MYTNVCVWSAPSLVVSEYFLWVSGQKFAHSFEFYANLSSVYLASNWIYFQWVKVLGVGQLLFDTYVYMITSQRKWPQLFVQLTKLNKFSSVICISSWHLFCLFLISFLVVLLFTFRMIHFLFRLGRFVFPHLNWFECVYISNAFSCLWFFLRMAWQHPGKRRHGCSRDVHHYRRRGVYKAATHFYSQTVFPVFTFSSTSPFCHFKVEFFSIYFC